ncbi:MAG: hypothetical protein J5509_07635 [Lachnospiraceae bacterium]|nr:hypothetical protein [Lachnospiraceae bacterium]
MAKGLGKVILTSSILAGAALGSYMFFKKEGLIDEEKTPAENAINIRNRVTADAAEYFNRDRSYVDLNEDGTEKAAEVSPDNIVKHAADSITAAKDKVVESVKNVTGSMAEGLEKAAENTEKAFEKAKEAAADAVEDVAEAAEEKAEEIKEAAEEKAEEVKEAAEDFTPGIQADKIAADSKAIGSKVSEEFFNDEA